MEKIIKYASTFLKLAKDKIPGGLADEKKLLDFNPKQLAKGLEVEMEHTNDPELALEIAKDHLVEDDKYYDKLEVAKL